MPNTILATKLAGSRVVVQAVVDSMLGPMYEWLAVWVADRHAVFHLVMEPLLCEQLHLINLNLTGTQQELVQIVIP